METQVMSGYGSLHTVIVDNACSNTGDKHTKCKPSRSSTNQVHKI